MASDGGLCHVVQEDRSEHFALTKETAERLLSSGGFFWLDLDRPSADDYTVLGDVFAFHPLALQSSQRFDQRAKIDEYDDAVFMVVYGAAPDEDRLVEVHCFYSERFLVTLHRDDAPAFTALRERYEQRDEAIEAPPLLLYRIVSALVDSFFPILSEFDDQIDDLEDRLFKNPAEQESQEIFELKRRLVGLRKAVAPERDMFASLTVGTLSLPGATADHERYFRDIYDHLIRISDFIDTYRDLLTSSMDVFLSTVSNRLNVVMKQLTVIATVFLPLTFITGFFGQNFGWLVLHVRGWGSFALFGLATEIAVVVMMLAFFRRRGWF